MDVKYLRCSLASEYSRLVDFLPSPSPFLSLEAPVSSSAKGDATGKDPSLSERLSLRTVRGAGSAVLEAPVPAVKEFIILWEVMSYGPG